MVLRLLYFFLPLLTLIGLVLFSASIMGGGCVPPATCAGSELGIAASLKAVIENPLLSFGGVWMLLSLITFSHVAGAILTVGIYGGLVGVIVHAVFLLIQRLVTKNQ